MKLTTKNQIKKKPVKIPLKLKSQFSIDRGFKDKRRRVSSYNLKMKIPISRLSQNSFLYEERRKQSNKRTPLYQWVDYVQNPPHQSRHEGLCAQADCQQIIFQKKEKIQKSQENVQILRRLTSSWKAGSANTATSDARSTICSSSKTGQWSCGVFRRSRKGIFWSKYGAW